MALKDWKKIDYYVYRSKQPSFGDGGTLYEYVWITSNNMIRINDGEEKAEKLNENIVKHSYVYHKAKTFVEAKKVLQKFMKE